jgi:multisubunit Na+/H+ antiporter MnhB subunit
LRYKFNGGRIEPYTIVIMLLTRKIKPFSDGKKYPSEKEYVHMTMAIVLGLGILTFSLSYSIFHVLVLGNTRHLFSVFACD